ncbi:hypothetical protein ABGB18_42510 [Nonomuraea sp. B12E4]|uniref:hypothetical protein n=1 Tax=Nonomuraea sp. B12E4 TaxID=3153564 RepID=UPI00325F7803
MSDFLIGAIVALSFVLLSLRPITDETRSWGDLRERARRAGWWGCFLGTLRVAVVAALLVLVDAVRICVPAVELACRAVPALFRGAVLLIGAMAFALMQAGRPAVGGTS